MHLIDQRRYVARRDRVVADVGRNNVGRQFDETCCVLSTSRHLCLPRGLCPAWTAAEFVLLGSAGCEVVLNTPERARITCAFAISYWQSQDKASKCQATLKCCWQNSRKNTRVLSQVSQPANLR